MPIITRAKNILLIPRTEWPVIAEETTQPAALLLSYVLPLALLQFAANVVSNTLEGHPLFGAAMGASGVLFAFALVLLCAAVFSLLSTSFGGEKNFPKAAQLAAYALTPVYIGIALQPLPVLGEFFAFAGGLYAGYLMALGLPVLLKSAPERAGVFALVGIVVLLVALAVLSSIVAGVFTMLFA